MKSCKKCGEEKPLDGFYKHPLNRDGRDGTCKECCKARARRNRSKRLDYYREYDRKRGNRHAPGYLKGYRKNNAIKQQAHNRVNRAVIDGRIVKPTACEKCGEGERGLHAHHDDYLRQLEVRWLCPGCHHQWHAANGEAANSDAEPLPRLNQHNKESALCNHSML